MNETAISEYITSTFKDVYTVTAAGDTFFFYDPAGKFPFATLVTKDDDYDQSSNLNRPAVFRLNIGVSKATFRSLFGPQTSPAGEEGGYDFTALDQLMPHPVYGRMYWLCILNPSPATFEKVVQPLLAEAYEQDVRKYTRKQK